MQEVKVRRYYKPIYILKQKKFKNNWLKKGKM